MLRFFKRLTWAGYQIADAIAPGSEYNASGRRRTAGHPSASGRSTTGWTPPTSSPAGPSRDPTLVWLGRIDPLKDVETLLRAFAIVRERIPTARLRIFGAASNQNLDYLERCIALRDSLGLVGAATSRAGWPRSSTPITPGTWSC